MGFRSAARLVPALLLSMMLATASAELSPVVTPSPTPAPPVPTPRLVVDPNAGYSPTPAPTAPEIVITGWGGIKIPAGVTEAPVALLNPAENEGWYYLTFEMRLKETDEVIFSTGLIPPGMYCTSVTLSRAFEPGKYACVMRVQPYMMNDDLTPTNNADLDTELIVE